MKAKKQKHRRTTEKRTVGAIVYLIKHEGGECEVMSVDRKVYASGSTLDQAFWRYYRKGMLEMKKSGKLEQAHPTVVEDIPGTNAADVEAIAKDDGFADV